MKDRSCVAKSHILLEVVLFKLNTTDLDREVDKYSLSAATAKLLYMSVGGEKKKYGK